MTGERPPVALLDWDNSLHPGFTLGPWLHALARDGREREAPRRFDEALADYDAGRLAYDAFARLAEELYTGLMDGRPTREVDELATAFAPGDAMRPGAADLVAALLAVGWRPILLSGAPAEALHAHAARLGIAPGDVHGWELAREGERYVGRLASGNTARGVHKAAFVAALGANVTIMLGLGDSDADRPMIDAARIGVRVDPVAPDEARRATWTDRGNGHASTGSLADLAAAVRGRT